MKGSSETPAVSEFSPADELEGSLQFSSLDNKLMHSVLENDKQAIDEGNIVKEMSNQSIGGFTPNIFFENLVRNYSIAKKLYGPTLIRQVTGYDDSYVERNLNIPEFRQEIKKRIEETLNSLKEKGLLDKGYQATEAALEMAALINLVEELDHLLPKGLLGKKHHKKKSFYGGKEETKNFTKDDRYRDLALKQSIKTAIRRGHSKLDVHDLRAFQRQSKGEIHVIFALDSSGSMKGPKLGTCKRAGIALAYNAIEQKDSVGLIVFGSVISESIAPTRDFTALLKSITKVNASKETDMVAVFDKAIELFTHDNVTRHLLLLTDALPTVGDDPQKKTLEAAGRAASHKITISIIGINLDEKGKAFAEKLVELGKGKLYAIRDLEDVDKIVLEDYYSLGKM